MKISDIRFDKDLPYFIWRGNQISGIIEDVLFKREIACSCESIMSEIEHIEKVHNKEILNKLIECIRKI